MLCACEGQTDSGYEQAPDEYVAPYVFSVDKTEIESSGADVATFSLKDAYGREMLDGGEIQSSVNIYDTETGTRIKRLTKEFSSIEDGTFTFEATYRGVRSDNTVTVVSQNRSSYETFHKCVALYKVTSVHCPACPELSKTLHNIGDKAKDHSIVISCHGNYQAKDPFSLYVGNQDLGTWLMGQFGLNSWPVLVYDMKSAVVGASKSVDEIESNIIAYRTSNPATCGIRIISSECAVADETATVNVSASVKSSKGGDYDLGLVVICDGLVYSSGYSVDDSGIYDDVLMACNNTFAAYSSSTLQNVGKNAEKTFSLSAQMPESTYKAYADDMEIVVIAHRRTDDGYSIVDNCVLSPMGEPKDYVLN